MESRSAICCGLDVYKDSITACLRRREGALLTLLDWLGAAGCTQVALESTGQYWKSVFHMLEGHIDQVLVVNAQHTKALPGRKTDLLDAAWIAQLLQHGLLPGSFIPPAPIRELRESTRYRTQVVRARAGAFIASRAAGES